VLIPKTLVAVAAGVIALQMASSATQAQNPGPRTGFILGRTIDAGTGQPVAGAVVTISIPNAATGGGGGRGQTAGSPTFADPAAFPQRAITNSAGYFLFRELPAGRFSIATNAMGYLNGGYLQNKPNGVVRPMDLGEGEKRADVQIKLWKYGAISGTVLDEAGEPAVGATVRLMRRGGMGSRLLTSAGTELTDDRGAYRFGNLLPGDYVAGFIPTPSAMPATLADSYLETRTADPTRYQALMAEARTNGVASLSNTGVRLGDLILEVSGTSRLGYTPPPPRDVVLRDDAFPERADGGRGRDDHDRIRRRARRGRLVDQVGAHRASIRHADWARRPGQEHGPPAHTHQRPRPVHR